MSNRYKFLRTGFKSNFGKLKWKIGEWQEVKEDLEICEVGLHCSKGIYQAFSYVQGEILAEVEVGGKSIKKADKECYERMRIVKAWKWQKKDSVLFSIYAARLVLDNYEKKYPSDKRPRQAIEAAEKWFKNPTTKNAASSSASSAAAASSAAYSAYSAAASSAAYSSAYSAAAAYAGGIIYKKLDKWMKNHLSNLKEIKSI